MKNRIITYPEYPQIKRDYTYTVRISDGEKSETIPVYSDIRHANHYNAYSMHAERDKRFCSFAFEGQVTVEVAVHAPFTSYIIAPSDDPVKSTFEDGVIRFTLDRPRQVAIRLDDDADSYLGIFADAPETDIPDKNGENVVVFNEKNPAPLNIQWYRKKEDAPSGMDENCALYPEGTIFYFEAGWHDVTHLGLISSQQIYIAPGAVLCGRVQVLGGACNTKIFGRGMLRDGNDTRSYNSDGYFCYLLTVGMGWGEAGTRSFDNIVKDITLLDATSFSIVFMNTERCEIDCVKVLAGEISTDGFSFWGGSTHINIHDCFLSVTDNLFVVGAGDPIDYVTCDNCMVGTSIKLFFPQGPLGEHSIFKNIHAFRASIFFESYAGFTGYLKAENVCAIDCPDSYFLKSGNCPQTRFKRFELKNATLPDTKRTRQITIAGKVNGKDSGGYEFDLDNVWFGDRQITELKTYPDTSHLYFKDESVDGTKVDLKYSGGYEPVLLNRTYANHKPLCLFVHWLPVFAPYAPEIVDGTPYVDAEKLAEIYRFETSCENGKLTLSDNEYCITFASGSADATLNGKKIALSAPTLDKNGRFAIPYNAFETLLGLSASYNEKEATLTLETRPFGGNLLVDYDFEDFHALRSWTTKNFTYVVRTEDGEGYGGGHAMRYGGDTRFSHGGEHGAYQYVFDQVLLYGAGTYRVSFMAKGEDVSDGAQIGAGLSWHYNANVLPGNYAPLTSEWKKYTFDIPLEESQIRPFKKMGMAIISRDGEKLLVDDVEMIFVGK